MGRWVIQGLILSRIKMWIQCRYKPSPGVLGLKTSFGSTGFKWLINIQVQNPSFNFQKHNLIFSKIIRWISSKIVKSQKNTWHWGLGYRNYIWATWAQEIYWAISSECQLQFPWTRPHFLKSYNMNPVKWWNVKKKFDLGVWV